MADEPTDERFDLRLAWPPDSVLRPVDGPRDAIPASLPPEPPADVEAQEAPQDDQGEGSPAPAETDAGPAGAPVPDHREPAPAEPVSPYVPPSPLEQIVALAGELSSRFDSVAGMASASRDAAGSNLASLVDELDLLRATSTSALSEYRERHLRMLVQLRAAFDADASALGWISGTLAQMSTAVDEALVAVDEAAKQARTALADGQAAVQKLVRAVGSVGEGLTRSVGDVESSIRQGGDNVSGDAIAEIRGAVQRSAEQLLASPAPGPVRSQHRLEDQLARLSEQLSAAGDRDSAVAALGRALDLTGDTRAELTRLVEELVALRAKPDVPIETELARLADEFQAVRRRLTLRSKAPVVLTDDQVELLAKAVAAEIDPGASAPARRPRSTTKGTRERPLRPQRD